MKLEKVQKLKAINFDIRKKLKGIKNSHLISFVVDILCLDSKVFYSSCNALKLAKVADW